MSISTSTKVLPSIYRGDKELRALIAAQDSGISADDVLVTAGAAGALFIISTSLLSERDHLVVVRPNYATNIETPKAIGCAISYVDLDFDKGFAIDLSRRQGAAGADRGAGFRHFG